jgi:hypothetical protein
VDPQILEVDLNPSSSKRRTDGTDSSLWSTIYFNRRWRWSSKIPAFQLVDKEHLEDLVVELNLQDQEAIQVVAGVAGWKWYILEDLVHLKVLQEETRLLVNQTQVVTLLVQQEVEEQG